MKSSGTGTSGERGGGKFAEFGVAEVAEKNCGEESLARIFDER